MQPGATPKLEDLAGRAFSFYPPILNIEHNEWTFKEATWSEVLVANSKSEQEIWIPRRFVGEISQIDKPVMIVGLHRELEYKAGTVWPHERRVVEMPASPPLPPIPAEPALRPPTTRSGRRRKPTGTESRIERLIAMSLGIGLVACILIIAVVRLGPLRSRVVYTSADQDYLELTNQDDYFSVVRKLGSPAEDRWRSDNGELQYRLLSYPKRAYSVILMGTARNDARYIGAMDRNWRLLHYVELPNSRNTASMMRTLPKF